jgi:hypothetical protein
LNKLAPSMLASFPASMLNQNQSDLEILNRFNLTPSRSRRAKSLFPETMSGASTDLYRGA